MKVIWKYSISAFAETLTLPKGAQVLAVQTQNDEPQLWALVDPLAVTEVRPLFVLGTGHTVKDDTIAGLAFVGTFQLPKHGLVFHVFLGDAK